MNIHDSGYKKLFSNQTIFRQLLETFVKQQWIDQLDFSTDGESIIEYKSARLAEQ